MLWHNFRSLNYNERWYKKLKIAIIGTVYVGLVTGTCLADFGLQITCVDQDETKISLLNSGGVPIYEPNLAPLIKKNVSAGRLTFTTDLQVPPSLRATEGSAAIPSSVIARSEATKQPQSQSKSFDFDLVSNPEFLREGSTVYDFTHPDKIECFDPLAMKNSRRILPDLIYCQDEYDTAEHCDTLVIATDWNQFRNLDLTKIKKLLKSSILLDLRNLYEPDKVKELGFIYEWVGRR
jgi:UDP-glucose 6-dehydrogenase